MQMQLCSPNLNWSSKAFARRTCIFVLKERIYEAYPNRTSYWESGWQSAGKTRKRLYHTFTILMMSNSETFGTRRKLTYLK
ncbi:unnamed protein product [Gongylonema pulchrum]|uniref:Fork-head domain-containing protein n=1 Tax=Gongylonema pulchrum TaxID=637853 RepID=A0A183EL78_9BILA|nr:unnamed protein product [Gongylonema pulchrum]